MSNLQPLPVPPNAAGDVTAFERHLRHDLSGYPKHPWLVDTAARTDGGECPYTVLEAVDADDVGLDPLAVMTT